ncbi:MAG: FAD-dependent oxidoreductase [Gammaproteobacteria bacterium]|nr:MAG: FAD-dependent oxidoreductase [Gammaproteobacteria bacterium]UCH41277.1 MAG: FAD-dependent oxidoreductase [Gammaproteobacteria bacterium]
MTDAASQALQALKNTRFTTYWLDSLEAVEDEAALAEKTSCDLLVVGGGFCGLWAAIQAKEQDPARDVVLIEAKSVANGASGRPAAIMSTSVMHGIDNTERIFPDDVAELERLGQHNMDGFRDTIERYQIDCDIEWGGEMKVSIGDEGLATVNDDHQLYLKYGHDAVLLDKAGMQAEINSPIFHGGTWSRQRSGTVHPGKLVRGLKRAALQLGVRLYENTPHRRNRKTATGIIVETPRARITARKVLLATNAWAAGHTHISRRVAAIRDRIVVTDPLTPEQMAKVGWQNRQGIYDTRTQLNYMRLTADNRILFGGRLAYFYGNNTDPEQDKVAQPYVRLVQSFYRTFPQLAHEIRFSHAWSGPIGLTTRMAVHYQRYHDGDMVYAGGYSGFGVTASRFGARVGLAILDRQDIPETRMQFALTVPAYIPPEPFRWLGAQITMYALDTLDEKGGWRKLWVAMVQKMGFPITL